jgi:hypothetical protein
MPRKTAIRIVTGVLVTFAALVFTFVGSTVVGMATIASAVNSMDPANVESTMPNTIASLDTAFWATSAIYVVGLGIAAVAFLWTVAICARWLVLHSHRDSIEHTAA